VEPVDVVLLLGLVEAALALRARPQAVLDAQRLLELRLARLLHARRLRPALPPALRE